MITSITHVYRRNALIMVTITFHEYLPNGSFSAVSCQPKQSEALGLDSVRYRNLALKKKSKQTNTQTNKVENNSNNNNKHNVIVQ